MDALLDGLNAAQKSAVTSPASVVQVLAPPGSGKTKTLTARVAYLISHECLQPWNIIVCTFTIKAAREMRERIRGFVGEGIESKLILGTFHSVARRYLSRYGQEIGIPKNFGIADTNDSKSIIKRIIERQKYNVEPGPARSRISKLKAKGVSAEQFAATQKKVEQHEFACIYADYEEYLKAQSLLDYDDLLVRCVELLRKHPVCVNNVQAVLIDEYQDTNNIQYDLMTLMASRMRRITIVGDPDQSIYSFRSAEIKNLLRMRDDYPQSIVINLENNYRSSGCILSSAMAVIEQDESRPSKPLIATHCVGEQPTLRHLATQHIEAKWIVEEIHRTKTLTAGLLNYNDYSILLRSAHLSLSIERALGKAGIPYRMVSGTRFFDRAEIRIVLDYLRVINQPDHNDALVRVINLPSRKIGDSTVKALQEEAETRKVTVWKLILDCAQGRKKPKCKISGPAQKGIEAFVNIILTSRQKLLPEEDKECNLLDLIYHVLQKISFEAYLKSTHKENWKDRWANVEELVAQATQMAALGEEADDEALPVVEGVEQRQDTAADVLSKFLVNVALSTELDRADGEEVNQVTISTIHSAKGLEWPVVFIPAVYDGSIPHSRAEDHDEERRLLYVGMTRAEALLYLSCPVKQSAQEDTVLSKFVSSRSIQKFFSHSGPSIGCSVIRDLAQILRRPCPLAEDVQAARSLLERVEDNQYPFTREEIDGEEPSWNPIGPSSDAPEPYSKRRRVETSTSATSNLSVTIQNSSSFSVATATLKSTGAGFTTARDLRALLEEAESIRMLASANDAASGKAAYKDSNRDSSTTATATTQTTRMKPRAAGQGAITSFFARSKSTISEEPDPPPARPSLKRSSSSLIRQAPLNDISNIATPAPRPFQARPYQPLTLPNHRPRNVPMPTKPKKADPEPDIEHTRYILLSSSPVKPNSPAKPSSYSDIEVVESKEPDSPTKQVSSPFGGGSGFRPVSTFHTTSVSQVQGHVGPQRKTLGMRRTMQGWSVKHSAPPRPRPS
ncbi:ATP-depentend DNA helicase-like protein [Lentithecium fluviatile CBS 122367]|uniref:DNA 3'-5' helicase n=1 Tax=Lentithecium fluviatile CBS 122367 TaxID=1168545 RepID=A0A6G1JMA7_9PLEO|nr:ATP-depentend DNA helicase-like protein [Lentithecium fluviatile CBS 122367]